MILGADMLQPVLVLVRLLAADDWALVRLVLLRSQKRRRDTLHQGGSLRSGGQLVRIDVELGEALGQGLLLWRELATIGAEQPLGRIVNAVDIDAATKIAAERPGEVIAVEV